MVQEKEKIKKQKIQTREELLQQVEFNKKAKEETLKELKKPVNNTFGPIDNKDIVDMQIDLKKKKKEQNMKDLQEQIKMAQEARKENLQNEFIKDRQMVQNTLEEEVMLKQNFKQYKLFSNDRNQKVWDFQKD